MKKITLLKKIIFSIIFSLSTMLAFSQNDVEFVQKTFYPEEPVCIYNPTEYKGLISQPARQEILNRISRGETPCSNFVVVYSGFTPEAQAAFQQAVDIWSMSIESSQTIRVSATFADLADGTLGSARSGGYITLDPATAPDALPNIFYPIPLAEKLSNMNTNGVFGSDIIAEFNNDTNEVPWYFGLDANPPSGQFDFVSVVLHELGHGLGFAGFGRVNALNGEIRIQPNQPDSSPIPSIYDNFIENGSGVDILTIEDPSSELRNELTSENLFCDSNIATNQNGNVLPKIFAPFSFNPGSSYSHWDEATFGPGNINSLMSPQIGPGEANHNPGPITLGFFEDMGWSICGGSLSVDDFDITSVNVSPNPFTNSISIELNNGLSDKYSINVIDINGRVILNKVQTARNGKIEINNLSNLKNALYFVQISNENSGASITKKVIKK